MCMLTGRVATGASALPQELVDLIIDQVNANKDFIEDVTLCTLVCRAWEPRSSRYALASVDLRQERAGWSIFESSEATLLEGFLSYAQSSSRLRRNVTTLCAGVYPPEDLIATSFDVLPNLSRLQIGGSVSLSWPRRDIISEGVTLPLPPPPRRDLPRLELYKFCADDIIRYLPYFGRVETLSIGEQSMLRIQDIPYEHSTTGSSQSNSAKLSVTTLVVASPSLGLLPTIAPMMDQGCLETLYASSSSGGRFSHLREFLQAPCSVNLVRIYLNVPYKLLANSRRGGKH